MNIANNDIIVFLGPSLSKDEAMNFLPQAIYLPPIRCGDIIRALRLKPKIIAIIDGYFEHTSAVWHKEILFAIESKVKIFGAASMGALRAAELHSLGMVGIGKIFQNFQKGELRDDDEVAVLHSPKYPYKPLTDAMVNIRETLNLANQNNIIDTKTKFSVLEEAKKLFYQNRTLENAIENSKQHEKNHSQLNQLSQWIAAGNFVDQKKIDAVTLLKTLLTETPTIQNEQNFSSNQSIFLRTLKKDVMCRPYNISHECLPKQEKIARTSRYLGENYLLTRRLAYLLPVIYGLACKKQNYLSNTNKMNSHLNHEELVIFKLIKTPQWKAANDADENRYTDFISRMEMIEKLISIYHQDTQEFEQTIHGYILILLRLSDDYSKYKKQNSVTHEAQVISFYKNKNPITYRIYFLLSTLWWVLDQELIPYHLTINITHAQNYSNKFRLKNNLISSQTMQNWLNVNDMDIANYQQLITKIAQFNYLVLENNVDILNIPFYNNEWWLLDALWLTDVYSEAKKLGNNSAEEKELFNNFIAKHQISKDHLHNFDLTDK